MAEPIKHECGIVLLRLLKPLEYYVSHYGTAFYGPDKLYLLMEKQHNRGQDGAGIGCIKFGMAPGSPFMNRMRSTSQNPIQDLFGTIHQRIHDIAKSHPERLLDTQWLKNNLEFTGELFLGHLRYGTYGKNDVSFCHPILRENNWMSKNLMIAGNFNMTNMDELFERLLEMGQHPNATSDTVTILEKVGHFLDEENEALYRHFKSIGYSKQDISPLIAGSLDLGRVLVNASKYWDGGYVIAGMVGHGDSFVMRDPNGIRPAYYYADEEVIVATSERPAIQTAFNVPLHSIRELQPGHALIIKHNGEVNECLIREPGKRTSCSFERIYFSRGTDADIYQERKQLGRRLVPSILKAIRYDLDNTIFSYIPNTAIAAYLGMVEGLHDFCNREKEDRLLELIERGPQPGDEQTGMSTTDRLRKILAIKPKVDQIAVKDAKLRTFITEETKRDDLVAHVYDVTYGVVRDQTDNLVVIDDSIVRGTTLKQSIVRILDRLNPRMIVIVSSAPQIRYPDCYGIDMARLQDFIAFRAAMELLKDSGMGGVISEVYRMCREQESLPAAEVANCVKMIYEPFCPEQISERIAMMLHPPGVKAKLKIVYQTIEDLHAACPGHTGDWYFTGNYPTPGGNRVANRSFINYIEGKNQRAY